MKITEFVTTPNPLALKCEVDGSLGEGPRSFKNATEASSDRIGTALFTVQGVTNVLIHDRWFTVVRSGEAQWKDIKAALERIVAGL